MNRIFALMPTEKPGLFYPIKITEPDILEKNPQLLIGVALERNDILDAHNAKLRVIRVSVFADDNDQFSLPLLAVKRPAEVHSTTFLLEIQESTFEQLRPFSQPVALHE